MATWAALAWLWWSLPPAVPYDPPLPGWGGSVVRTADFHLGVRAHSSSDGNGLDGAAVTIQLSATALP